MRVFYASGSTPNGALPASRVWRENLFGALVDLGHDVVEFDFDLEPLIAAADFADEANARFVEEWRPVASRELVAQVREAHAERPLDLFFSYLYSSCVTPDAIREIRAMGITTMNWYCNASYQFRLVEEIAPAFDVCLVPEQYRIDDYRRIGANPIYCQEAANPLFYLPQDIERDLDVVFVGACYGERPELIRTLVKQGLAVTVFGPGWDRPSLKSRAKRFLRRSLAQLTGRPVPARLAAIPAGVWGGVLEDGELAHVYSRAKIALGFSSVGQTHRTGERITQVRLRDFEVPMSGAFYLVEQIPELGEFFDLGEEIETYRDIDELVEKCRYYLMHDDERERVRRAGHARALRDHTWQRRLTDVFTKIGLPT
jgi:spore maturation protein CgeB